MSSAQQDLDKPSGRMADAGAFSPQASELRREIEQHEKLLSSQSYLQRAITSVYHPAGSSLRDLKLMAEKIDDGSGVLPDDVQKAVAVDRRNLVHELKFTGLAASALTVAPLFIPGPLGLAGSAAINALNTAVPRDSLKQQSVDLVLGAIKGVAIKGVFAGSNILPGGYLTQSFVLGPTQSILESTLNSHSYFDPQSGTYSLKHGLNRAYEQTFDPSVLGASLVSVALAGKVIGVAGRLYGEELAKSPLLASIATGAISGWSAGITDDIRRLYRDKQKFDMSEILTHGMERAAIGALVAAPGSLIASRLSALEMPLTQSGAAVVSKVKLPDMGERQFTVHLPAGWDKSSKGASPVCIVALHGCFMDAAAMGRVTGLSQRAKDAIVVYPEGNPVFGDSRYRIWGGVPILDRLTGSSLQADSQYLAALTKYMRDNYNTDPRRTFLLGYSAGGNLALQFAINNPREVAAVSSISAGLPTALAPGSEQRLPSILQINSRHDRVMPVSGRDSVLFPVLPRRLAYQSLRQNYGINSANKIERGDGVVAMGSGDGGARIKQMLVTTPVGRGLVGRALGHEFLEPAVMPTKPTFSAVTESLKFFEGH